MDLIQHTAMIFDLNKNKIVIELQCHCFDILTVLIYGHLLCTSLHPPWLHRRRYQRI